MSGATKVYLDLKKSIPDLYQDPAYYLKQMTTPWSLFEKPYLGGADYRAMHLGPQAPTWGGSGGLKADGGKGTTWTFQWGPPKCWMGAANADCGQDMEVSLNLWAVPPHGLGAGAVFTAWSSDSTHVWLKEIKKDGPFAATAIFGVANNFNGTVTICGNGSPVGQFTYSFTYSIPPGADPQGGLFATLNKVGKIQGVALTQETLNMKSETDPRGTKKNPGGTTYSSEADVPQDWNLTQNTQFKPQSNCNCGCSDVTVTCTCGVGFAWNPASATSIAQNGTATVSVLANDNSGSPYTWSVSGTGFSFDNPVTAGASNTLKASSTACGTATINVTGCGGKISASGVVLCTTGKWIFKGNICGLAGAASPWDYAYNATLIVGNKKQTQQNEQNISGLPCEHIYGPPPCNGSILSACCKNIMCNAYGYASQTPCLTGAPQEPCVCYNIGNNSGCPKIKLLTYYEWGC